MMHFAVLSVAAFVGLYLAFMADNALGLSSPGGGIDMSDAVSAVVIAASIMLVMKVL